jgi:primary-amine oxidase
MHPLDPLTAAEITAAGKLIQDRNPNDVVHFKNIALIEPPKRDLRKYLTAERRGNMVGAATLPRRVSALYYHRGTVNLFFATVNLDASEVETTEKLDTMYHGHADMDEVLEVRSSCLSHPAVLERIRQHELADDMDVVCDTWPYGRDSDDPVRRMAQVGRYAVGHYEKQL